MFREGVEEFVADAGILGLARKSSELLMLGQARGADGMAKLLINHTSADPRVYRYDRIVKKGVFSLDATQQVSTLKGVGAELARHALPVLRGVFFSTPADPFEPVLQLQAEDAMREV